jgi:hypothetical protein
MFVINFLQEKKKRKNNGANVGVMTMRPWKDTMTFFRGGQQRLMTFNTLSMSEIALD